MLQLSFTKTESSAHIAYTREDGSSTWSRTHDVFVRHDLVHLAIETTFGFQEAFFGLIESGSSIQSFEEKSDTSHRHVRLPSEAYIAEVIVGHLDNARHSPNFESYPLVLEIARSLAEAQLSLPENLKTTLKRAIKVMKSLHSEWDELPPNSTLKKHFPLPLDHG